MEKLNYEQLKEEVLVEGRNDYMSKMNHSQQVNTPMLKILFDYFNVLNDRKKMQKEQNFVLGGFIDSRNNFIDNLPEHATGSHNLKINLEYKGDFSILIVLSRYFQDGEWISNISFTSNKSTYVSSEFMYKKIIFNAIAHSNLKGSYFTMPPKSLNWTKRNLIKKDFSDIYLPESTMQDLKIYSGLFEKRGEIMRYLLAGTPGTGKTEATIVLANILNQKGVTVIKTVVCEALKEKVELAELLAPCVLILDDIDLSLGSRSKGGFSQNLGPFLDVLDGTDKISSGVGIIATTNALDLVDKAASRPGRFDKIMTFENITSQNIKDIILKSIRATFKLGKNHPASSIFTHPKVVNKFLTSKVTGAHIFNYVGLILKKIDVLEMEDYDENWIISEIESELKVLKMISGVNYLKDNELKNEASSTAKAGFQFDVETEEEYDEETEEDSSPSKEQEIRPSRSDEDFRQEDGVQESGPSSGE
jgi:hypothetical protein